MSLELARLAYPILVRLAREQAQAARDRRALGWVSYDDLCLRCQEVGIKETPRTITTRLLKPLQQACLENDLPDLSSLIVQKPKPRSATMSMFRPSDGWWEPYIEKDGVAAGDVKFWFEHYKIARDYPSWPETPPF
jgi:hypothetical protein